MALFLSEKEVAELLPMKDCISALEEAFRQEALGEAENRPRTRLMMPKGSLQIMPATYLGQKAFGYKAYTVFPGGVRFLVMLHDSETGQLLSIMEAGTLGQIRTGAASGLATKYMANQSASVAGIIGSGYQAQTQLEAICAVRPIKQARVYSRTPEKREAFAKEMSKRLGIAVQPVSSAEECVRGADVIVTITNSRDPLFKAEWLTEGTHINAAGSNHWMRREIDADVVQRAELIVVDDLVQAKTECGDLIWPVERGLLRWEGVHELKEVVKGHVPGRPSDKAITLFESQGVALEDVAAATMVYRRAKEKGKGRELPF